MCPSIHPSIHPNCLSVSISFHLTTRLLKHTTFSHSTDSLIEPGHLHTQNTLEPLFCALSVSDCPSVPQSNNLSIYLSIYLSVRPSIHPSIHPYCLYSLIGPGHLHRKNIMSLHFVFCLCLSIHPAVSQSICPTVRHVCLFIRGSDSPSLHPSIHPSSHPSLLSICLYFFFI